MRKEGDIGFCPKAVLFTSHHTGANTFPQENSKLVLPLALTLPSLFLSLDNLLWPEWHPLVAFNPWFTAHGAYSESVPKHWGGGGLSPPHSRCHSGRWWRGLMWIAPVSLIEWTLQLCYVLNCMWLMPFFFRLQAGHSCFFKEIFIFLGRRKKKKTQHYCKVMAMVISMYSVIRHDQSSSCFSLPLFLVNQIMCKN